MAINELLTREEMDALLDNVADNPSSHTGNANGSMPYELLNPENAVRNILPLLENIHERFAHRLQIALFELLRRDANVLAKAVKTQSYEDFIHRLATPCSINIVEIKPLDGLGLLVIDRALVFAIVDAFFGGSGQSDKAGITAEFTLVEMRLVRRLLKLIWQGLQTAWQPYANIECLPQGSETNPQFVTALNAADSLVLSAVQIDLEATSGELVLALPCCAFEPIRESLLESLSQERPAGSERLKKRLQEGIQGSQVSIRCLLLETSITVRDLLHLSVGDIIALEVPSEARLEADGVPLYAGQCGVAKGWRAIKITETLTPLETKATDTD